jgi:glutathione S-transferase
LIPELQQLALGDTVALSPAGGLTVAVLEPARALVLHYRMNLLTAAPLGYLFGADFTAADCAAFPFLKYALAREPDDAELFHRILDDYQSVSERPRLAAWIERVDRRPRV